MSGILSYLYSAFILPDRHPSNRYPANRWNETSIQRRKDMRKEVKNLMFDLGGVIMDLCRKDCVDAFTRLGMKDADSFFGEYCQQGPFLQLETGDIPPAVFRDAMRQFFNREVSDQELDAALSKFQVGIPVERLVELEKLRGQYKIYLLSNTNPILWEGRIATEFSNDGHDINYYFDGMVTSFEARVVKPDPKIFEIAARQWGIEPGETLFFDDSAENIKTALQLGWQGVVVKPGSLSLIKILEDYLNSTAL